jgi:tetratricopeptide (TPR) repeat protein
MKKYLVFSFVLALVVGLSASLSLAQSTGSVKGVCKDADGKPIAGAVVEWTGTDTGRTYNIKTNNKGEYFSLGITPGKYNVKLLLDGKELDHINGAPVGLDEFTLDFDLKKEQAKEAAGQGLTPEQLKARQEQQEKVAKEQGTVKQLNDMLTQAKTASDAKDYDKAISVLNDANAIDSNRDPIWGKLADAYLNSAVKQTDSDEKKKRYEMAAADYQKAIDLRKASEQAAKEANNNKNLAIYYNNLGQADSKIGKLDDAIAAYNQAVQLDATNAGMYYFNEGAVYSNAGKVDDALAAFNKVIAIDPATAADPDVAKKRQAAAYYQKGINLIGKATIGKDNKMIVPDGTAEAFQKYLELDPDGRDAQTAKDMLASIGASVETGFGKKKASK